MTQYHIGSSHGELTADNDGHVIHCRTDNNNHNGGAHLASIVRFDIAEWRRYWNNPRTRHIDILDVGYWYTAPGANNILYAPPDETWRKEIAEILLKRGQA
jgi:hypothetical protein